MCINFVSGICSARKATRKKIYFNQARALATYVQSGGSEGEREQREHRGGTTHHPWAGRNVIYYSVYAKERAHASKRFKTTNEQASAPTRERKREREQVSEQARKGGRAIEVDSRTATAKTELENRERKWEALQRVTVCCSCSAAKATATEAIHHRYELPPDRLPNGLKNDVPPELSPGSDLATDSSKLGGLLTSFPLLEVPVGASVLSPSSVSRRSEAMRERSASSAR